MSIKIILATLIMNVLVGEQHYSTYSRTQTPDLLTCRGSYLYKYNFGKTLARVIGEQNRCSIRSLGSHQGGHLNSSIFVWEFTKKSCNIKQKMIGVTKSKRQSISKILSIIYYTYIKYVIYPYNTDITIP